MTYDDWLKQHGTTFGMLDPQHMAMLDEWLLIFQRAGYSVAELVAATAAIAMRPPKYRSDHLPLVHEHVRDARQRAARAAAPRAGARHACTLCEDSGQASVPVTNLADRLKGRTCVVCCGCAAGRAYRQVHLERRPMTIEQYEQLLPDWREQSQRIAAQLAAERAAEWRARQLDREHGPLAGALDGALAAARRRAQTGGAP